MTHVALIVKEDGLIYVNEVPEEPTLGKCSKEDVLHASFCEQHPDKCICNSEWIPYQQALASAKENAVLCADQEYAEDLICGWNNGFATNVKLTPGIYPIPDIKWEVKQKRVQVNHAYHPKFEVQDVAILTLSEQPKQRQKELLIEMMKEDEKYGMYSEQPKGELLKDFTPEMSERLTKHIKFESESQEELTALDLKMFIEQELGGYKTVHIGRAYRVINRQFVYESDIMSLAEDLLKNFTITRNLKENQ